MVPVVSKVGSILSSLFQGAKDNNSYEFCFTTGCRLPNLPPLSVGGHLSKPFSVEVRTSSFGIQSSGQEMKEVAWERPFGIAGAGGEAEVEGTTGLALSSSTPMGRPVTY